MAIESLAQQTSVFVDSLQVRSSAEENTADENAQEAKTPEQGDTVSISEEARSLVATEKQEESSETDDEESSLDQTIRMLKEQIQRIKQEIEDLENSKMPDSIKDKLIQAKRNELAQYQDALLKLMEEKIKAMGAQGADSAISV